MEADAIIIRKVCAQIPPKIEYSLPPLGRTLKPVLMAMHTGAERYVSALAEKKKRGGLR